MKYIPIKKKECCASNSTSADVFPVFPVVAWKYICGRRLSASWIFE